MTSLPCVASRDLNRYLAECDAADALELAIQARLSLITASDGPGLLALFENMHSPLRRRVNEALLGLISMTPTCYANDGTLAGCVRYVPGRPEHWTSAGHLLAAIEQHLEQTIEEENTEV